MEIQIEHFFGSIISMRFVFVKAYVVDTITYYSDARI